MSNEEQMQLLKQGVGTWNKWRRAHSGNIDLRGANLPRAKLSGANLFGAILRGANLNRADLSRADLRGVYLVGAGLGYTNLLRAKLVGAKLNRGNLIHAELISADLTDADLTGTRLNSANLGLANLSNANLTDADLSNAYLGGANLSGANLSGANLSGAHLDGARLNDAYISKTIFAGLDLQAVDGLDEVRHGGPSEISVSTIYRSEGKMPEIFFRGCGFRDWEIEASKLYRSDLSRNQVIELTYKVIELRSDPLIQFNSCFISYSRKDKEFAKRLYSDLQGSGVRCWFAPEDMKIGDRLRNRIDDSILLHDKLLLILSEISVASQWIEQEVETALAKEREQSCEVLFPIRLDDSVLGHERGWPALIRNTRHIGDFCRWEDEDEYKKAFVRLLNNLRVGD